jgi:arginyl-tRNA synthetase
MLRRIKKDLLDFRVEFDVWRSEREVFGSGAVEGALNALKAKGLVYEKEGALWFKSTEFGDDKDRVIKKADDELTYFATDVAYHREKADKGFDLLINVWGADHHGYEARVRASLKALGVDDERLKIIFIQLVSLLRGGVPVPMGKREGEFVTLREVMDEVGVDACRFFFLSRKSDAHLEFDLELAKRQAPENPVYYVQYCHARISSIAGFAKEKGMEAGTDFNADVLGRLTQRDELNIIRHLSMFDECVEKAALAMEPHRVTFYLTELAGLFHPYYNTTRVVSDDKGLTEARLLLCEAVKAVIGRGLALLGISSPEKM